MLTIGELADQTGVATTALRYYDELGLVRPIARAGGQRRYADEARHEVGVVLLLRDLGFTLAEIARLLTDPPRRRATWESLARSKLDDLDRLIDDAQTARTALIHALQCPLGDLAACPTFWSSVDARLAGRALDDDTHDGAGTGSAVATGGERGGQAGERECSQQQTEVA